ncbi:MAG: response regulator [Desulfobulbaceae bacterium]|nr:response regulator [Desulfobulbaceae bacterium]
MARNLSHPPPQTHPRVLVVDDVPLNRHLLAILLSSAGWEVIEAKSGEEVLELLAHDRTYSLILMDINLTGITGIETVARLRSAGIDIPVIAVSGYFETPEKIDMPATGLNGFLPKPVLPKPLWAEIHRVLGVLPENTAELSGPAENNIEEQDSSMKSHAVVTLFDYEGLLKFCNEDETTLKKLLFSYTKYSKEDFDAVKIAVKEGNPEKIRLLCHKIAGAAGTVRSEKLKNAAQDLGRTIREEKTDETPASLARLLDIAECLLRDIELHLNV